MLGRQERVDLGVAYKVQLRGLGDFFWWWRWEDIEDVSSESGQEVDNTLKLANGKEGNNRTASKS